MDKAMLKTKAARESLQRLKVRAPRIYRHLMQAYEQRPGLGAIDWGKAGENLIDALTSVAQYKEISEQERKAALIELEKLKAQNAAIERQLELKKQLVQVENQGLDIQARAALARDSLLDNLADKPWALPALGGLLWLLFRGRKKKGRR